LSFITYLLHDDVTGWTDYVNKCCGEEGNLEVLAIVLILKKRSRKFSTALRFWTDMLA